MSAWVHGQSTVKPKSESSQTPTKDSPTNTDSTDLKETLQWLEGATDAESAKGAPPYEHYGFHNDGDCKATITETRLIDGKTKQFPSLAFSLKDIDPADIQVEDLASGPLGKMFKGQSAVTFHAR